MAVDMSGLVNALATQPGQNMAQLGQTIATAQNEVLKQKQLAFENRRAEVKDALERQLAEGRIATSQLQQMKLKSDIAVPIAGKIAMAKDPLVKQQLFEESLPTLQKIGVQDTQLQEMRQNLNNEDYWIAKVAEGLSAKDTYALLTSTGVDGTQAAKKKQELINAGVNPIQAEGIAYGTYKTITDPATGDQKIIDLRSGGREVPEDVALEIKDKVPSASELYKPKIVYKGNKEELRVQADIKKLSEAMIKTGAPKVESPLETVEAIIRDTFEKGKDLPGYGATSALPDWAVSEQAQDLRQSAIKLFNIELAERSGAAVTKQELDRLRDEFKSGLWRTDRQFVTGVKQYRDLLEDYKKAVVAGYPEEVISKYQEQGGIRLKKVEQKPKETSTGAVTEERIRADAKENGWTEEQVQEAIKKYVRK